VVQDISGLGRCSMTAAVAVLSVLGVQPCPAPSAVLSNQTGYGSYALLDCEPVLREFPREWQKRGLRLDGIYTGFFSSLGQVEATRALLSAFRAEGTLLLVDPVMADHGRRYPCFDDALCAAVKELAGQADVLTPNVTEACLLTGCAYGAFAEADAPRQRALLRQMAERLLAGRAQTVVITGWRQGGRIGNAAAQSDGFFALFDSPAQPGSYSGTGDLFASALCGYLLRGVALAEALPRILRFLEASLAAARRLGCPGADGVPFEPCLRLLLD
jgi:pyridoxine kinase